ncbi:MAG: DUF1294 domain-containing protein [Phycisphaerae bacterium]|nr:DUF1294 domain-containing protein [Phycisphaerae bacterium]
MLWAYGISVNIAAFLQYGYDKRQAAAHGGRVPEIVLHLTASAGGSVGALAGQRIFRHKTRKRSFQAIFLLILIVQIAALVAFLWNHAR